MANALDYIAWRGDLSFEVAPINEVDLFLCTQMAMLDMEDIVSRTEKEISLAEAAGNYFAVRNPDMKATGVLESQDLLPGFLAMSKAKRYKNILMSRHVNYVCIEDNEQFSALVYRFSPLVCAVVFRGTDDTLVGWKEDCNMAVYDEVPAQRDALKYLETVAAQCTGKIIVAGHSKGGNLAVYAASNAGKEIQDRIVHVFNYDGPGFPAKFIEGNRGYASISNKIMTIVSQYSIIGMLMEAPGRVIYVKSLVDGLRAHDAFNWEVEVNHFTRARGLTRFSRIFDDTFTKVIERMTTDEKKQFVNDLFAILFETGADTLTEFKNIGILASVETVNKISGSRPVREFFNMFMEEAMKKRTGTAASSAHK